MKFVGYLLLLLALASASLQASEPIQGKLRFVHPGINIPAVTVPEQVIEASFELQLPSPAVRLVHPDGTEEKFFAAPTEVAYAKAAREANGKAKPGDRIEVYRGTFLFGKDETFLFKPYVQYQADGMNSVRWIANGESDVVGISYVLTNSWVDGFTFEEVPYKATEDGRCLGFSEQKFLDKHGLKATAWRAFVSNCRIVCNDWAVYSWQNEGVYLSLSNCEIRSGRFGVAMASSGSGPVGLGGQSSDIVNCRVYIDASKSVSVGATSNKEIGMGCAFLFRGGTHRVVNCQAWLVGNPNPGKDSYCPNLAGVSDFFGEPPISASSGTLRLTLVNFLCSIRANGTRNAYDFDLRNTKPGVFTIVGPKMGSGPEGAWITSAATVPLGI